MDVGASVSLILFLDLVDCSGSPTARTCRHDASHPDAGRPDLAQKARPEHARGQGALAHERAASTACGRAISHCCPRRTRPSGPGTWPTCATTSVLSTPTEEKLVTAIAVAMWKEIRADRAEAGVLTAMPCDGDAGRDLGDQRHALSLGTAIRYASAAGMATQRAQRAFLAHRKAKKAGLILTAPATERAECTNDLSATARPEPGPQNRTNDFPQAPERPAIDLLTTLRARISRLFDGADTPDADQHDLAAAVLAVSTPDSVPYQGRIDLALLTQALKPICLDSAGLARLATLAPPSSRTKSGRPCALAA